MPAYDAKILEEYQGVSQDDSESDTSLTFDGTKKYRSIWSYLSPEKHWSKYQSVPWTRDVLREAFQMYWWAFDLAMLVTIIVLIVLVLATRKIGLAGDINGFVPESKPLNWFDLCSLTNDFLHKNKVPHRTVTFQADNRYLPDSRPEADGKATRELWKNLLPSMILQL